MEYEVQEMTIKAQKAKAELNIRQRVLDATNQPVEQISVLSSTSENKLLNKPATSTVRTSDLKRLESQVKTAQDLENGLRELNKLAKETLELASTDEQIIKMKTKLYQSQAKCTQLEKALEVTKSQIDRLTSYIQQLEQWFSTVKEWIYKRKLLKDFEQYVAYETKELVREEIKYDEHERD